MNQFVPGSVLLFLPAVAAAALPISAHFTVPEPPSYASLIKQAAMDFDRGQVALRAGDYAAAEADLRASLGAVPSGEAYRDLAAALTAQGRVAEAVQTYHALIDPDDTHLTGGTADVRALMGYAVLLSQTGNWNRAVVVYEAALPLVPGGDLPMIDTHFDSGLPQPAALAAAAHIALGLDANWRCDIRTGDFEHDRALKEYTKALQLEPDWGLANFYYGYGLERLGRSAQAQVAFNKTIKIGYGSVKLAAVKALKQLKMKQKTA